MSVVIDSAVSVVVVMGRFNRYTNCPSGQTGEATHLHLEKSAMR